MSHVTCLGFPRMGRHRELKRALESHWRDQISADALLEQARALRREHWQLMRDAGADVVPCNDFSLYDHVLDTAVLFGAVPTRYRDLQQRDPLAAYFAMARGRSDDDHDLPAMEMTKWFDTNYHYIVPELEAGQSFALSDDKPLAEFREASALGHAARPVILGPLSFLLLSKTVDGSDRLDLLDTLLPAYADLLAHLADAGAEWVQLDEPCLSLDLDARTLNACSDAYLTLAQGPSPKRLLATYFGAADSNVLTTLPVDGVHLDLISAPAQLDAILATLPAGRVISLGIVDGRNVWRSQPQITQPLLDKVGGKRTVGELWLAPSCSLLHVPVDLELEDGMEPQQRACLAFAIQKIAEVRVYADALSRQPEAIAALAAQQTLLQQRSQTQGVIRPDVRSRLRALSPQAAQRRSRAATRRQAQRQTHPLPLLPTTSIGSFPQTDDLRQARAAHRAGRLDDGAYEQIIRDQIRSNVRLQEDIGLDVLVHGEPERNDMAEYFGERLDGFLFTRHGWVQSYGSRCVKPPVIFGDVARPAPMTVAWSRYAQSLTERPMKGMLTGPVTLLQWSFVRNDLPRETVCNQIALALRDEVHDLEAAGIGIIQIDEPALREGLPLRRSQWQAYLDWAVHAFRIAAGGVGDATQIHTHMCYSEFNDIIESIATMDADVISIESSRSRMELLTAFDAFDYPNGIGPGVYDIHSPRVPDAQEMQLLLRQALTALEPSQLWVNPDCGLKTRRWNQAEPALRHMVEAARAVRETLNVA